MESGSILEGNARRQLTKPTLVESFSYMFSYEQKDSNCAELFKQAGSKYITEKDYVSAVRCLDESNRIHSQTKDNDFFISSNIKLILQHGKDVLTIDKIISYYVRLGEYYTSEGNMPRYNEQYISIAKLYEDDNDYIAALSMLDKCVETKYNDKIMEKKGYMLIKLNRYKEAADTFLKLIETIYEKRMMLYSLNTHIFMYMLCLLASDDIVSASQGFEFVLKFDPMFHPSNKGIFVKNIINAIEDNNLTLFEDACAKFTNVIALTPEHVTLLTQAKKTIVTMNDLYISEDESDMC